MPDGKVLRMSSRSSRTRGLAPPALALREPGEGAAGHELPGGLGNHVVVGRGAPAGERGQVLLMPADLPQGERVMLEQAGYARPVIQQAPDPGQADQPDAEFDAAGPVHAGQEGVLPPPGAQLVGDPARVSLVMAEEPGRGQQREVLQPGELPYLLDVADLLLGAVIDAERVAVRERTGGRSPGRGTSQAGPGRSGRRPGPPIHRPSAAPRCPEWPPGPPPGTRSAVSGGKTAANLRSPRRRRGRAEPSRLHLAP